MAFRLCIGKAAKNVKRADALKYVLGYTCANDVSARDWQKNGGGGQWCRGKTFATFCPLGPVLAPQALQSCVENDSLTSLNTAAARWLLYNNCALNVLHPASKTLLASFVLTSLDEDTSPTTITP